MPYTFEYEDGAVRAWALTETGVEATTDASYRPTVYAAGPADVRSWLADRLAADPKVAGTRTVTRHTSLHEHHRGEECPVLAVDLERIGEVRTLAHEIRGLHERETLEPGTIRLFDVDLPPGFRYCRDREIDPTPGRDLRTLSVETTDRGLAHGDLADLAVDGEAADIGALEAALASEDPDVLVVSHGDLVPALSDRGVDLGRRPGWTRVAGANTYESYGQVGHSPARYRVPGRAIVDTSNSFLWHQSGLEGILYMVGATGRPLQEAAWGSIGTLLTARQIRLAGERGVLAPWNKWEPESFTDVRTLHAADRGGFTFAPEVGLHEAVHEIDFASLYPRIICERNVSPETIGCACDRDVREHVPELGYPVCSERGFLPDVLEALLADRAGMKRQLREDPPADEAARLRAASGAIKWILVSCFGYQGYRNAKFGRIECHEAINAYARQILLDSKARLEAGGWRVVHGIVDSLWVTAATDDPEPLESVVADIGESVGIALEHDGTYEWVCFVPRRSAAGTSTATGAGSAGPAGALTRYFGRREDGSYKFRGIEVRQRSTPDYVAECQRDFVETLHAERDPRAVCAVLERHLTRLERGMVDPADLTITTRVSRRLEAYTQETLTVAALRRSKRHDVPRHPGQSVEFVVVDDGASRPADRVRLPFECADAYDADFYAEQLVRACESVVSPLGWDRERIRRAVADGHQPALSAFLE